ncbi:MAG: hypothetical protein WAS51_06545 [Ilumatobacteraceae bacterium]
MPRLANASGISGAAAPSAPSTAVPAPIVTVCSFCRADLRDGAVVAGGALLGVAGTVLAVPMVAIAVNVAAEAGIGRPIDEAPSGSGEGES